MEQQNLQTITNEQLAQHSLVPLGLHVGILTKLGAFFKSWKVRYFSLTWNHLSYYDPVSKDLLASIPLHLCERVVEGTEKGWPFHLVTNDRTYIFLSQSKRQREEWIRNLGIMIAIHQPDVKVKEGYDVLQKVSAHILNIRYGTGKLQTWHFLTSSPAKRSCVSRIIMPIIVFSV
eukprot:TRINITY_DN4619_c0_g2_i2.p1 TRINITY_DN4619_c0_g2~~TRINITY_DN4619_c0_g2_i2.p1  ORF type:complete len:204 (-),score=26.18 TRINITY_DN4619_c0_g2_i2:1174-1698(-)